MATTAKIAKDDKLAAQIRRELGKPKRSAPQRWPCGSATVASTAASRADSCGSSDCAGFVSASWHAHQVRRDEVELVGEKHERGRRKAEI